MHTLDEAIEIQANALRAMLTERLEADRATRGLAPPSCFAISPMGSGSIHFHHGANAYWPSPPVSSGNDLWSKREPEHVRPEAIDATLAACHLAMRQSVQQCTDNSRYPANATLVHPVLLALLLAHEPNRARMPLSDDREYTDRKIRWEVDDTGQVAHPASPHAVCVGYACGRTWLENGILYASSMGVVAPIEGRSGHAALTVVSSPAKTTLSVPGTFPAATIALLKGRTLADAIGMPTIRDGEVAEQANAAVISDVRELANGIEITFAPTRFVPYSTSYDSNQWRRMALAPVSG